MSSRKKHTSEVVRVGLKYAEDIAAGKILAGKYTRLACVRHLNDLKDGHKRGLYFCETAAEHICNFFTRFLKHSKGEWAGRPVILEPWQVFCLMVQYGWMKADGFRRFRIAWNEIPRKNGKSFNASGKGLYALTADGEPGAEVYAAATKKDQARIVHAEAVRMVRSSPALLRKIKIVRDNLHIVATNSKFEPLSADHQGLDGLNTQHAAIDEIHAHRTRDVFDLLETSMGARRQPMIDITTTAGQSRHSIGYELHDYAMKVLEGIIKDDSFFAFIACADDLDDFRDPKTWAKANPNLGISCKIEDLQNKVQRAIDIPGYRNTFERLHLNRWTEQAVRWIPMETWDLCGGNIDLEALYGAPCWAGLDLSTTQDTTALVLVFDVEGRIKTVPFIFIPEDTAKKKAKIDRVPYLQWIEEGYLEATPGPAVDYDFVRAKLNWVAKTFDLQEVQFDRWNSTQIIQQVMSDGIQAVECAQNPGGLSAASKELERLVVTKRIEHGDHPVLRWMASNVAIKSDYAGNITPAKDKSTGRIDGIVALIMALRARGLAPIETDFVYNYQGIYVG